VSNGRCTLKLNYFTQGPAIVVWEYNRDLNGAFPPRQKDARFAIFDQSIDIAGPRSARSARATCCRFMEKDHDALISFIVSL
jgi:hypothetical protein